MYLVFIIFFFSEAYQRLSWEALKKSINGLVNKVSTKLYFKTVR